MSEFPNYIFRTKQIGGARPTRAIDAVNTSATRNATEAAQLFDDATKQLIKLQEDLAKKTTAAERRAAQRLVDQQEKIVKGYKYYKQKADDAVAKKLNIDQDDMDVDLTPELSAKQSKHFDTLITTAQKNSKQMDELAIQAKKNGNDDLSEFFNTLKKQSDELGDRLQTAKGELSDFTSNDVKVFNERFRDDLNNIANSLSQMASSDLSRNIAKNTDLDIRAVDVKNLKTQDQLIKMAVQDLKISDRLVNIGVVSDGALKEIDDAVNKARLDYLNRIKKEGDEPAERAKYFDEDGNNYKPDGFEKLNQQLEEVSQAAANAKRTSADFTNKYKDELRDKLAGIRNNDEVKDAIKAIDTPNGASKDIDLDAARKHKKEFDTKGENEWKKYHEPANSKLTVPTDMKTELVDAQKSAAIINALSQKEFVNSGKKLSIEEIMFHLKKCPEGNPNYKNYQKALSYMENSVSLLKTDDDIRKFREMTGSDYAKNLAKSADNVKTMQHFIENGTKRPGLWGRSPRSRNAFKAFLALAVVGAVIGSIYASANIRPDPPTEVPFGLSPEEEESYSNDNSGGGVNFNNDRFEFTPEEEEALRQAQDCIDKTSAGIDIDAYLSGERDIAGIYQDMDNWQCHAIANGLYSSDDDDSTTPAPSDGLLADFSKSMKEYLGENWIVWLVLIIVGIIFFIGIIIYTVAIGGGSGSSKSPYRF